MKDQYFGIGFVAFACSYLFTFLSKYKDHLEQTLTDAFRGANFFNLEVCTVITSFLGCTMAWVTLLGKESLTFKTYANFNFLSNLIWIVSGSVHLHVTIWHKKHFLNWEFYEKCAHLLGQLFMLVHTFLEYSLSKHNVMYFASISTLFFITECVSYICRTNARISAYGSENLNMIMSILRDYKTATDFQLHF